MKVTIAIPCWNQAQYLPEAIESALNQTYQDVEIIVVNDGSPDNTKEIAEKYPVKIINQANKGLSSARNSAIMAMTGDFFLPLDADDKLELSCVQKIVLKLWETNADIVAPSIQTFGTSNQTTILMENPMLEDFKVANRISYCSAIRKSALLEVGGYSPRMTEGYEDLHLWVNLLSRGKRIVTIPEPLMMYRTKEESMWKNSLKHHDKLMAQIYKDFPEFA